MMNLDPDTLAVESFATIEGDPTQWLMAPAPTWDERESLCRPDDPQLAAMTVERICSGTF
jgi:hypothetical protein